MVARFPAYDISTDLTSGRVRYVARARSLNIRPYLIIAATLSEVVIALEEPVC